MKGIQDCSKEWPSPFPRAHKCDEPFNFQKVDYVLFSFPVNFIIQAYKFIDLDFFSNEQCDPLVSCLLDIIKRIVRFSLINRSLVYFEDVGGSINNVLGEG